MDLQSTGLQETVAEDFYWKPLPLSFREAMILIGGLSEPSKMPGYSWSTSALMCKTGTKLRETENSVCSGCYAMKGNYRFPVVKAAHDRRLEALSDPRFVEAFIIVLTKLYLRMSKSYEKNGVTIKENRFRWHDSGDLQSVLHLTMINNIAIALPHLDFWLPTKEAGMVKEFLKGNKFATNLNVRLSHSLIGGTFKKKPNGLNFSTVGVEGAPNQCPAYGQGGKCLNCSNCWDSKIDSINYPKH